MKNKLMGKKSGVVLVVVLWILVILSFLMLSLGRNGRIEAALVGAYQQEKQAKYLAWAGINFARHIIRLDTLDDKSKNWDNLLYCGIPEDLDILSDLKQFNLDRGYFSLVDPTDHSRATERLSYGFHDEERRININALDLKNIGIFISLLEIHGVESSKAEKIGHKLIEWSGISNELENEDHFSFNQVNSRNKNFLKHAKFDTLSELLLIDGIDKKLYDQIEDYLTVFPKDAEALLINFDTAPEAVLRSLGRAFTKNMSLMYEADADSLARRMIDYRSGLDGKEMTKDDRIIDDVNQMKLNTSERTLFAKIVSFRAESSQYLRVVSKGALHDSNSVMVSIEAVIRRDDLTILSWHRY